MELLCLYEKACRDMIRRIEFSHFFFFYCFLGQDLYNEKTVPMLEKMVDTGEVTRKAVPDDE